LKDRKEKKRRKGKEKNGYKPHRCRPPHLSQPLRLLHTAIHLGGNFPTSVAARKPILVVAFTPFHPPILDVMEEQHLAQ